MIKDLFVNDWITVKEYSDDIIKSYVFSHETRSNGRSIAILPFRTKPTGGNEFLLKGDIIPAWGLKIRLCSLTGAVENGSPTKTAVEELYQEAGYSVEVNDLIALGTCYGSKASSTVNFLYTVNLTGLVAVDPPGDGDEKNLGNESHWTDNLDTDDPLVSILSWRTYTYLVENNIR